MRPPPQAERDHNYDTVAELVAARVAKSHAGISAKRLLPIARTAGYDGSDRNFRRLVADAKRLWRSENHRGRRPAVWAPGEYLVIDPLSQTPALSSTYVGAERVERRGPPTRKPGS